MMKIFSGIQPSGVVHIGNYLGAMKNWAKIQTPDNECIYCVVDYHAITVDYPKDEMPRRIIDCAKDIIAAGVDPEKSTIFLQSDIKEHTELAWLLNTITNMGELNRMTQYKEKAEKHAFRQGEKVGLFDYPVLMAADILIYKAEGVPVGEDQVQHVELTRDLARRFNSKFGETFPEPKPLLTEAKRVMSLSGEGKMSKSEGPNTYIALTDDAETIRKKISSATTDDGKTAEISPATMNLIGLMGEFGGKDIANQYLEQRKAGTIKYSEFKPALTEAIIKELEPFQKKRAEISDDDIKRIFKQGVEKLQPLASQTIKEVKEKMGLKI
ncbi:tryptophan--tRNA ligase [Candidatus Berkelbacteria bacterium RBG_13_40_8]|uniref:Tryptophan--tRNA ligase n=1 Tax=Candidatus Berkelbacteria bacterium RBG_13_40_8 TaxID=1797467 RepID=A0A1F5DPZ1_9BACT|nr:MAG: tryptophan--tRNA ligase [Candidatus Berkelbacteria bacterium RBG_13_40_8]